MRLQLRREVVVGCLALVAVSAVAVKLYGAIRIGGWSFSANGQVARNFQYTGGCPVNLKFDWGVIDSQSSAITYQTSRSDGAQSGSRVLNHPGANRSVPIVESWRLGANTPQFANYRGWMQLNIESPAPASHRIAFTLHCQ